MSALDIEALVKMEKDFYLLRKTVDKFAAKYLEFLDLISTSSPDLSRIEKYNLSMTELQRAAAAIYENGLNTNPRSMILYANFMRVFLLKVKQAASIVKRIEIFEEKIKNFKAEDRLFYDLNLMFSERSTIIHLGANMDNLGKILHVNVGATILTKYSMHELVNLNVNKIMTTTISNHHQNYLLRAFKKGVFSILYKEQRNFVVDKNGFASPISLLVKPMYNVGSNMFQYISYLQPIAKTCRYILTNPDGLVECFSENFGEMMDMSPKSLNSNGRFLYIQTLMPILMEFFLEKKVQGGCTNETIDDFMKHGIACKNYKLNIRQEISTKLLRFRDSEGMDSFYPYPEEDTHNQSRSTKQKGANRMETNGNQQRETRIAEEIKQLSSGTWSRLLKWHKNNGSPAGMLYQVDMVFHPIKTSSTYIFVFQIKSVQVLNRNFDALSDLGQMQFGQTKTEKGELSLSKSNIGKVAARGVVVNGNLVRIPTNSAYTKEPGASVLALEKVFGSLGNDPLRLDSENKLLKLFGDFFAQQIFFEDPNRITKKFEHDKSESLDKNESMQSFMNNEASNEMSKNLDSLKDSLALDVMSQLSSQNKASSTFSGTSSMGDSRQEEDITSIPELEYFPREYSLLKTSSVFMVSSSIGAILIVLALGATFNSSLSRTIEEFNLYKDLDLVTMSIPTFAYLQSILPFFSAPPQWTTSVSSLLSETSTKMHNLYGQLGNLPYNPTVPTIGDKDFSFSPVSIHSSALGIYQLSLYWLTALQRTNQTDWMVRDTLSTVLANAEGLASGALLRSTVDWTPDFTKSGITVLVVLLVGFVLSTTFAFWMQHQSAKCYDYLNRVYGIMTSFPGHVIRAQKMLVVDLYDMLETRIEEKKVQVKIRKSGIRSEERAKMDLGLKTSGKIVGEIEVPRFIIILGITGLLLLIAVFDVLVLLNMGFFTKSNDQALELNWNLMRLQIGMSGFTYSSLSKSFQPITKIPPLTQNLQKSFQDLLQNTLVNIEDAMVSLAISDSKFNTVQQRFLADQCSITDSTTFLSTDLFQRPCNQLQGGALTLGIGRSLSETARVLPLISQEMFTNTTGLTAASQPTTDALRSISSAIRVQAYLFDMVSDYKVFLVGFFSDRAAWSIVTNILLVTGLAAVSSLGWYFLLKGFQKRILESKNVVATLPPLVLQQNMRAKKFLQAIFEEMRKT